MREESFERWLKNIKNYNKNTINARRANCQRIEEFYGDLDEQYKIDKLEGIRKELNTANHKIPIKGNYYTGTATLKSALRSYLEFKDNIILDRIMSTPDIDSDKHDGSYELVRETLESLSRTEIKNLGLADLDMLYSMSVGTWKMSIDIKNNRIEASNLIGKEKLRLKSILERIKINAKNYEYENREKDKASIGMFGTGFFTFKGNTNDEETRKFISLLIEIKDLKDEDEIFNILEEGFKDGISGIQSGSASMILHCLKPTIFPIINGAVIKSIVVLEGMDLVLNKGNLLTTYIENTKILKKFRDEHCKFKNYRVLDKLIWDMSEIDSIIDPVDKAWFVGAVIDNKDCTDEFIEKGIWICNSEHKYKDSINSIKLGDRIAIKSRYNKQNDLPFYSNVKSASVMRIKAIGTVKEESKDGKTLNVDWQKTEYKKEWFFFTIIKNIWEVERSEDDWMYGALLDFTFNDAKQDIERFLNHPFWSDRYSLEYMEIEEKEIIDKVPVIGPDFSIPLNFGNLYFSDEKFLKSQISIALKSGKSIILIGPPGTGKSKIAKSIAESYGADAKMVTAMSDWSSYDTIGGYKPKDDGSLYFEEGMFLSSFKSKEKQNINKWLLIDEINRADIDKAFGPFFSALSGDDVELGFKDDEGRNIELLLEENLASTLDSLELGENQYIIPKDWRIIGTMNTFDKTSLYEMSYAFMRRFAFIPVAIPKDIDKYMVEKFFKLWDIDIDLTECGQIAELWKVINRYRKVGPAIVEDIGNYVSEGGDYTSAIVIYILPQLEGLFVDEISLFVEDLKTLDFINDGERLVDSIEDFFNISLPGK